MKNYHKILIEYIHNYPNKFALYLLVVTNFVCNNIFLFNFKYYSDDWSSLVYASGISCSITKSLCESQRPISNILFVFKQYFSEYVLFYHLLTLVTSTIFLITVYYLFIKIFKDFGETNKFWPTISALIFSVLFNKDEIYPWAILCDGFGYFAPLLTIYFYMYKEKKNYLLISIIMYFLSLMTYEVGVMVPVFLLGFDYLRSRHKTTSADFRKAFYFIIPLVIYLVIRITNWFGFGTVGIDRGVGQYGLVTVIAILQAPIIMSLVFIRNIEYSLIGYTQMGLGLILLLTVINLILLYLVYQFMISSHIDYFFHKNLVYSAILLIITFMGPYIIRGGLGTVTREYYLTDIGLSLFIVCILMTIKNHTNVKIIIFCFLGFGIIVNQGLFYNWVISGNIQNNINNYIEENNDKLSKYEYVYFNATSYKEKMPYNDEYIFSYQKIKNSVMKFIGIFPKTIDKRKQDEFAYYRYFNANCLDKWALQAMIDGNTYSEYTLIYGSYGTIPVNVTKENITYKDLDDGRIYTIKKEEVFEINYTGVEKSSCVFG